MSTKIGKKCHLNLFIFLSLPHSITKHLTTPFLPVDLVEPYISPCNPPTNKFILNFLQRRKLTVLFMLHKFDQDYLNFLPCSSNKSFIVVFSFVLRVIGGTSEPGDPLPSVMIAIFPSGTVSCRHNLSTNFPLNLSPFSSCHYLIFILLNSGSKWLEHLCNFIYHFSSTYQGKLCKIWSSGEAAERKSGNHCIPTMCCR